MASPLALIITFIFKGIVATSLRHFSGLNEFQISWILNWRMGTVCWKSFIRFFFILCHTSSIILRSGLLDGQSNASIPLSASHFLVDLAQSCYFQWDMISGCLVAKKSAKMFYFCTLIVPSTKCWSFTEIHPQTIIPCGNFTVCLKQFLWNASDLFLITCYLRSPKLI